MTQYDIGIIGNGIAAKCLKRQIKKLHPESTVIQFSDEKLAPPCSHRTTGVVSLSGIKRGVSPLGDTLVSGYEEFENYVSSEFPLGINQVNHYFLADPLLDPKGEKIISRFEKVQEDLLIEELPQIKDPVVGVKESAYLIYPHQFLPWLEQESWGPTLTKKNLYINEIKNLDDGVELGSLSGEKFKVKTLYLACGGYISSLLPMLKENEHLKKSREVPGNYLVFDHPLAKKSFVLSMGHANLIYRKDDKRILIGGSTNARGDYLFNGREMKEQYDLFQNLLGGILPPFEDAVRETGLRQKGWQRKPFWGEVDNNIKVVSGLYKNGWSLSFLAAKELI